MNTDDLRARDEFYADMLPDFLDEASENLERLNERLLQLDEQVKSEGPDRFDAAVLNEMFRSAHTLKGLSGMLGLQNINALTHKVENVFDAARSDELKVTPDVVEVVFEAFDRLTEMIGRLKEGQDDSVDCDPVIQEIAAVLQWHGVDRPQRSQFDAERAMERVAESAADTIIWHRAAPSEEPVAGSPPGPGTSPEESDSATSPGRSNDPFAELQDDADLASKYVSIFVDEAELTVDELTETLLAGADESVAEKVLVLCHRMKGSAATVGLRRAAKLAHFMEDLLQELHDQGAQLTVDMTDAMLDCAEALRLFVANLKRGQVQTSHFHKAYDKLLRSRHASRNVPPAASAGNAPPATTAVTPAAAAAAAAGVARGDDLFAQIAVAAPAGASSYVGQITFRDGLTAISLKADLLFGKLANAGDVFYCVPPANRPDDVERLRAITFGVATEEPIDVLASKLRVDGVAHVELRPVRDHALADHPAPCRAAPPSPTAPSNERSPTAAETATTEKDGANGDHSASSPAAGRAADKADAAKPVETVRVDVDRLDQLMNLAGQLVINKARFAQISGGLRQLVTRKHGNGSTTNIFGSLKRLNYELDACEQGRGSATKFEDIRAQARRIQSEMEAVQRRMGDVDEVRHAVHELLEAVHQLDRVSHGIQKCVMDTRMVPIGPLFTRFKRVVRDVSRGKGKEIRLEIRGEKTELDKRMIDELGDPLIHVVRNSADHGIEAPDERIAVGKPREGTVTLDASHRGNSIVIKIIDDGQGLDAQKIRQKAVQKGLLSATDAEKISDQQAYQLIWEPGLSTAEKITEVSGRGMGMDIIRAKVEQINGTVELHSVPGQGTTITIKLPLTLAILPSLLAEIDGDVFAIPVETVSEIVRVTPDDVAQVHGLDTATVRGRVISVVRLTQLFEWHAGEGQSTTHGNGGDKTLVIIGDDGREIGLVVDRLLGEEDVVIKSLAENYRNVEGIAGASILGNGRVSLILDVGALVERSSHAAKPACLV